MSETTILELEILSGPLDGANLGITKETEWTCQTGSLLSFPWDDQLGEPQARFVPVDEGWRLEPEKTRRGTHLIRPEADDQLPAVVQSDDILKASSTWLRVGTISP